MNENSSMTYQGKFQTLSEVCLTVLGINIQKEKYVEIPWTFWGVTGESNLTSHLWKNSALYWHCSEICMAVTLSNLSRQYLSRNDLRIMPGESCLKRSTQCSEIGCQTV